MKKIVFIVNPISGTKGKTNVVSLIESKIDRRLYDLTIVYTEYAGHAVELARLASESGVDVVVAVGGDGTINEVARSLADTETVLGIIPCGSGNGLARHIGLPMNAAKSIDIINQFNIVSIDYGKANNMKFFCTCGVGFDAFVSLKFSQAGKRGVLTYLEQTLNQYLTYKPEVYELETENGVERREAFQIACANASQYGNNAYIAPQAKLTDGYLDVIILKPFTVIDIPALAFMLFNKTIDNNKHIETLRCKKLTIRREKEGVMHYDGDPTQMSANINIEIVEKGLKILAPKKDKKPLKKVKNTLTLQDIKDFGKWIVKKTSEI